MSLRLGLYSAAFLRALGTSALGVFLAVYLAERGLSASAIGAIVSAGLAGTAIAAGFVTFWGDRFHQIALLTGVASLSMLGVAGLWIFKTPTLLGAAALIGMANGMGRDRGAALVVEQALLPATGASDQRTQTIAWYTMLQDFGHALGALLPSALNLLSKRNVGSTNSGATLGAIAGLSLLAVLIYLQLDVTGLPPRRREPPRISARSRGILARICGLFAIDALAGGFLTTALVSYFFFERFGVGMNVIGPLFFGARLMNAVSHLAAAKLAKRIGLVATMVATHIPSSLLLITVAFAPTLPIAIVLFLLREGLVEMDVPTRQSYVLAVVEPNERTFASGITNLVRLGAWAVAPWFAGSLMQSDRLYLPLVIGAAMKIAYDLMLWRAFRSVRPPEEQAAG
jgi:MFS family permease